MTKPPEKQPPGTAVGRFKARLLHGWPAREEPGEKAKHPVPAIVPPRQVGFPSRIAEFLLVFRLRARRRSALSSDILERAVRVVFVTCKNWFAGTGSDHPRPRKPD